MTISLTNLRRVKLNQEEQLVFLDYLQNSLKNGFSLNSSIELMIVFWPQKAQMMKRLDQAMKQGARLSSELLRLGFSKTIATQINMAMQQGNLVECLEQVTILERLKNEQFKMLKAELSYPFVLAGMMLFLLAFMQSFVMDKLNGGSDNSGDVLIIGLFGLIGALVAMLVHILSLLKRQDYKSMLTLIKYPLIGEVIKIYVNYLLVYDIGLLLSSGFSLQKMCSYASSQEPGSLQQAIGQKISQQLNSGKALTEVIKDEPFLPDNLILLLKTGSQRQTLSQQFLVLGKGLFIDLTCRIEKLVVNVQPLCFILIGICVIGVYLKLLLPMYSMMQGI